MTNTPAEPSTAPAVVQMSAEDFDQVVADAVERGRLSALDDLPTAAESTGGDRFAVYDTGLLRFVGDTLDKRPTKADLREIAKARRIDVDRLDVRTV